MSGETERNISGWTVDTLHGHLSLWMREKDRRDDQRFVDKDLRDAQRFEAQQLALRDALSSQEKAVNAALLAAQTAVQKAETAAEKRFEAVNEFRGQLADQAAHLMPRNESAVLFAGMAEKVTALEARVNEGGGRSAGLNQAWGYVFGVAGLIIAAVTGILYALR